VPVILSAGERKALSKRARGAKTAHRDWLRAQIVLACQLPAATGVPLSRWSAPELAAELTAQGLVSAISPSSVLRILAEHPIKPWQYQSWIFPCDPDFAARAAVILDLYQGCYRGQPLRSGDRVISVDAKPSIQACVCCHATCPPGPGRPVRVEHEYDRAGALALLAALDVRTGKVFASCPPAIGIASFMTCRKRSSHLATSPARPSSPPPCWLSPAAATRPPGHLPGSSPLPAWPGCSTGSALAMNPPACHTLPDDPGEPTGSP
jgi:hypothetical protein